MPSLKATIFALFAGSALASPAGVRLSERQIHYHDMSKRQNDAAAKLGLTDPDILQL